MIREENKPIYAASSTPLTGYDFREAAGSDNEYAKNALNMPGYKQMLGNSSSIRGGSKEENHVSFAKCLLLVFEKAINVQF